MNNFCSHCGTANTTNSNFCPNCGAPMNTVQPMNNMAQPMSNYNMGMPNMYAANKTNGLALAGFITAMISLILNFWGIVGIVATILSGVGISKTGPGKEKGRGLAIAGLIIGIFSILYGLLQIIRLSIYFS